MELLNLWLLTYPQLFATAFKLVVLLEKCYKMQFIIIVMLLLLLLLLLFSIWKSTIFVMYYLDDVVNEGNLNFFRE